MEKNPILIYQLARVGSKSIEASLSDVGLNPLQLHYITCENDLPPRHEERRKRAEHMLNNLDKLNRLNVITIARDPIERNISRFWIGYHHNLTLEKLERLGMQHASDTFNKWLADGNIRIPYYRKDRPALSPGVTELHSATEPLRWFDKEFKPTMGVDVYKLPKPHGKAVFHKKGKINIMIVRTEDLRKIYKNAAKQFLGKNVGLGNRNGSGGWTKKPALYTQFKRMVKVPRNILDKYYNHHYTKHFYSDEEIANLYRRWSK